MRDARLEADAPNPGIVVSVRGSVVDMRFDRRLPPIHSVLRTGAQQQIVIKVQALNYRPWPANPRLPQAA